MSEGERRKKRDRRTVSHLPPGGIDRRIARDRRVDKRAALIYLTLWFLLMAGLIAGATFYVQDSRTKSCFENPLTLLLTGEHRCLDHEQAAVPEADIRHSNEEMTHYQSYNPLEYREKTQHERRQEHRLGARALFKLAAIIFALGAALIVEHLVSRQRRPAIGVGISLIVLAALLFVMAHDKSFSDMAARMISGLF
jgi:hypothetical protein